MRRKNHLADCYLHIDELPIYNWHMVNTTGDLKWLVRDRSITNKLKVFLPAFLREMHEQYVAKFGFSETFLEMLQQEIKIALYTIEKAETGNDSLETRIDIEQFKLDQVKNSASSAVDFFEMKAYLDKKMGFTINIHTCSVTEYNSYLKLK